MSTAVLSSASTLSMQGLSTLNAVLGSTESSRAVAAIIELIKDEFKKSDVGRGRECVGYLDLFSGTVGFVLLQRWGRRKTEREFRENGGEEVIWDAVIDDKGFRADVVGTKRTTYFDAVGPTSEDILRGRPVSFLSPAGDEEIEAIERGTIQESLNVSLPAGDQTRLSDEEIREHIINQLPRGCHAVIASEAVTAKTIRVDLYNAPITEVKPPRGTVMVREHFHHQENHNGNVEPSLPAQTVVFRTALRRTSSADIEPKDKLRLTSFDHGHPASGYDSDDAVMMRDDPTQHQIQLEPSTHPTGQAVSRPDSGSESGEEVDYPAPRPSRQANSPGIQVANQKRTRRPGLSSVSSSEATKPVTETTSNTGSYNKISLASNRNKKKVSPFMKALKQLSPTASSSRIEKNMCAPAREPAGPPTGPQDSAEETTHRSRIPRLTPPSQGSQNKSLPQPPTQQTHRDSGLWSFLSPKSPQSALPHSHYAGGERRHDTMVHETGTYSPHSFESRPVSPTVARTHSTTTPVLPKARSDRDINVWEAMETVSCDPAPSRRKRSRSFVSSLYSMATSGSETSLILAPKGLLPRPSIFDDHEVLNALSAEGKVPGIFPDDHLVRNVRRYARFSSASYGSQFLRFMGLTAANANGKVLAELGKSDVHHEHSSFSKHTGLPPDTILLSSFEDPHGGIGCSRTAASALPLVHFISIDHESKAVVLTCRGTLGFEDVLTDMLCDFDDLNWRGTSYKLHKGLHTSARRMLGGKDSRVMAPQSCTARVSRLWPHLDRPFAWWRRGLSSCHPHI